jgi:hypothetical protein
MIDVNSSILQLLALNFNNLTVSVCIHILFKGKHSEGKKTYWYFNY